MVKRRKQKITRGSVLFAFGVGGIIHETVRLHNDRPMLLLLFAYMTGLPVVSPYFEQLRERVLSDVPETPDDEARGGSNLGRNLPN